jgi:hypothetical protein
VPLKRAHVEPSQVVGHEPEVRSQIVSSIVAARRMHRKPPIFDNSGFAVPSGVEAGGPRLFPTSAAGALAAGGFERVVGSLQRIDVNAH